MENPPELILKYSTENKTKENSISEVMQQEVRSASIIGARIACDQDMFFAAEPVAGPVLFFCRTPLQALILSRIVEHIEADVFVVYHPTSNSIKHHYYFEKIDINEKYFIPWNPLRSSDTLTGLLTWWRIPKKIRNKKYASLFISSIGSIPFSLFSGKNPEAKIYTYDDGTFNLSGKFFEKWIYAEPFAQRLLKHLIGGCDNPGVLERSCQHFTIFPGQFVVGIKSPIKEINIFEGLIDRNTSVTARKVRVLLGSCFNVNSLQIRYEQIVGSGRFDVFLPHPAESRSAKIATWIRNSDKILKPDRMIAEDVVAGIVTAGYRPIVYGFNSTALINLARLVPTINIILAPSRQTISNGVLSELGVHTVRCYEKQANQMY